MENEWKNLWNKRSADDSVLQSGNLKQIILELKRSNGYDVIGDGLEYDSLIKQYQDLQQVFLRGMPDG